MRERATPRLQDFCDTWISRRVAQLLVCLLVFQTFSLQLLSHTQHWNPSLIPPALERVFSSVPFGPASAEAGILPLVPENGILPSLDVDGNGQADALTDGMIILRYLFEFKNAGLINGVLAPDAQRTEPAHCFCLRVHSAGGRNGGLMESGGSPASSRD